jgi:hypothetical protein
MPIGFLSQRTVSERHPAPARASVESQRLRALTRNPGQRKAGLTAADADGHPQIKARQGFEGPPTGGSSCISLWAGGYIPLPGTGINASAAFLGPPRLVPCR